MQSLSLSVHEHKAQRAYQIVQFLMLVLDSALFKSLEAAVPKNDRSVLMVVGRGMAWTEAARSCVMDLFPVPIV